MRQVFGFTICNDVTARCQNTSNGGLYSAKNINGFAPIGPMIVSKDEIKDPHDLRIQLTRGDGNIVVDTHDQDGKQTQRMGFSIAKQIAFITRGFTLYPGDIVLTGSPHKATVPGQWIRDGENITVTIEGIGSLTNTFRYEK